MNILFINNLNELFSWYASGGDQRTMLMIRALSKVGNVDIISFRECDNAYSIDNCKVIFSDYIQDIPFIRNTRYGKIRSVITPWLPNSVYPLNTRKEKIIDDVVKSKKYDIIAVRYMNVALSCGLLKYSDKLVLDIDDNPKDSFLSMARKENKLAIKMFYYAFAYSNDILVKTLAHRIKTMFYSHPKQKPSSLALFLPNICLIERALPFCNYEQIDNNILFIGYMGYYPNYLGVDFFIEKVFPMIRKVIPDAKLIIVGKETPPSFANKWKKIDGVIQKGLVKDIISEYQNCRVMINPIFYGSGTAVKVLETMYLRRPCVSSKFGMRGYEKVFESGKDYLLAKKPESFATQVINILKSEKLNHYISDNAYKKVTANYSAKNFYDIVANAVVHI